MRPIHSAMRGRRRSRGSVFLLSMVALVTLLFLGTSLVETAIQGLAKASRHLRTEESACLAESGVDMCLAKLYENYDSINETLESTGTYTSSFTLSQGTVTYTVTAPYSGIADTCLIVADATTWTNRQAQVRAIASYQRDVDRVFEGAIFSNSPLTLNGGGGVYPDADGNGGQIYANGDICFNGTSFTMTDEGALYTTGTTNWVPPQVPATSVYQGIAPIPMPTIDLDYYQSIATTVYNGNTKLDSDDLQDLSGVIYVNGNLDISGDYTGTAVIVAKGNIKITGNVTAGDPSTDAIALITTKAVKIAGTPEVHGLIYSHSVLQDSETTISGDATIYGAIIADVVTTNGGISVHYRNVWDSLPIPGRGKTQWAQLSWELRYL